MKLIRKYFSLSRHFIFWWSSQIRNVFHSRKYACVDTHTHTHTHTPEECSVQMWGLKGMWFSLILAMHFWNAQLEEMSYTGH